MIRDPTCFWIRGLICFRCFVVRRSRWGVSHGHRGPGRVGSGFPDHRPCTGGGKPWRGSCSSRPAVVPSFSNAGQCPALLPISPWPTAPRGCIGGVHAPRVSAVCGIRICSSGTRWMGALPALRLISPCRPFPRSATGPASCVPAHPALLSFPRLLPPSFSNAGQRSVLLPILTGVLSRVAVVGEG